MAPFLFSPPNAEYRRHNAKRPLGGGRFDHRMCWT
jgi:hypothetical protein